MSPHDRLRLAAAIVHTVPGAELCVTSLTGEMVTVRRHPIADVDPCVFRRMVVASGCEQQPDLAAHIASIDVTGALEDCGGGVFASHIDHREQRWIATVVAPQRVADLLDDIGLGDVPAEAMHACLKPDTELAVTVVAVTVNDGNYLHLLDDVAATVAATCFVEEVSHDLCTTADQLVDSDDQVRGVS